MFSCSKALAHSRAWATWFPETLELVLLPHAQLPTLLPSPQESTHTHTHTHICVAFGWTRSRAQVPNNSQSLSKCTCTRWLKCWLWLPHTIVAKLSGLWQSACGLQSQSTRCLVLHRKCCNHAGGALVREGGKEGQLSEAGGGRHGQGQAQPPTSSRVEETGSAIDLGQGSVHPNSGTAEVSRTFLGS